MKTTPLFWLALPTLALLAACNPGPKSGRGFVLPEGDAVRGEKAFVELKCTECHRVDGVASLPAPVDPAQSVLLGGEVSRVRTYGDLVTAVIHPAYARTVHVPTIGGKEMNMPNVNETITVAQLRDIVTFLQPHYRPLPPVDDRYNR
ncbi:MAG TPA: c-type cytochrome [Lacunisphaera sp.]|nr:c-type cytochrome [Lacunisphaera sp.]